MSQLFDKTGRGGCPVCSAWESRLLEAGKDPRREYMPIIEMFQELEDMLDSYASDILQQDITPILRDVFRFVGRNKDLCRVFLARQAVDRFSQRLNTLIYHKCLAEWRELYQRYPNLSGLADRPEEGNYALEFVVAGAVGLIRAWLERGAQESPEEMAQLTGQLILSGVYSQAP